MLPSFRHFLRFIDLDSTFLDYGFTQKVSQQPMIPTYSRPDSDTDLVGRMVQRSSWSRASERDVRIPTYLPVYNALSLRLNSNICKDTDFISAGGPENFSWNVIRSEADYLMFQHARNSGAKVFDGVKVNDLDFDDKTGHPLRASYTQKATGTKGTINFRYLVDASGRAGLVNTKYMKNRTYNKALKNLAHWGYWRGTKPYQEGMGRENSPFFEALKGLMTTLP